MLQINIIFFVVSAEMEQDAITQENARLQVNICYKALLLSMCGIS